MSEILKIQVENCFFSVLLSALFEHPLKTFELAKHDRKKSESVSHSVVSDPLRPQTVAHQAPLSMEFSRQEYWSG